MAEEKQFNYGIGTPYGNGKAYHQSGLNYYAEKVEAERRIRLQNAKVVLKEKRMKVGNTLYSSLSSKARMEGHIL